MPTPVRIPKATISMVEGTILRWLKAEGDSVAKDDLLFEMETDKAILEVPATEKGMLLRIVIPEGVVRVEQIVAWVGQAGEAIPEPKSPATSAPAGRIMATPAARRRGRELGIELATVRGSGPGGKITEADVERAVTAPATDSGRKELAHHLTSAWQTIPHIHIAREIDAAGLMEGCKIHAGASVTDLLLFALSRILPQFPVLAPSPQVDIAFAVDTPAGVVTPVLRNAGALDVDAISRERRSLAESARQHRLKLDQLQGGLITLSNLGMEDVDYFAPIINAPQSAILAAGTARRKPVVVEDALGIGWRMWVNLAVDHRVVDGVYAARLLGALARTIQDLPRTSQRKGEVACL